MTLIHLPHLLEEGAQNAEEREDGTIELTFKNATVVVRVESIKETW